MKIWIIMTKRVLAAASSLAGKTILNFIYAQAANDNLITV